MAKKILTIFILLITVFSLFCGCTQQTTPENNNHNTPPINPNGTLYVGGTHPDYTTIQEAVYAAKNGATIVIRNGVYNELIDVNKTLTLIGEDKNTTILNFNPNYPISQVPVIRINANNCSIENLHITLGNTSVIAQGISINSKNNTIKNTIITNITTGIDLLSYSGSNTIINNVITDNLIGINGIDTSNNNISHNTFLRNTQYNIYLSTSSDNNNVSFNAIKNGTYGIRIKGSTGNRVYKNCIIETYLGLYCCCGASLNYLFNNSLIDNNANGKENAGLHNLWSINGTIKGYGNYWSDYNGTDLNHDGIGDTPYHVPDADDQDFHPLMAPPPDITCITEP